MARYDYITYGAKPGHQDFSSPVQAVWLSLPTTFSPQHDQLKYEQAHNSQPEMKNINKEIFLHLSVSRIIR